MRKIVVSLGTHRLYGFRRAVERLVEILPDDVDVLWQTGCTDVSGLGIDGRDQVPSAELDRAIEQADLLVAHAGTGIALTAFLAGKSPVLVPREFAHGEHVDDHQLQTANLLDGLGLAEVRRVGQLDQLALQAAASRRVVRASDATSRCLDLHR